MPQRARPGSRKQRRKRARAAVTPREPGRRKPAAAPVGSSRRSPAVTPVGAASVGERPRGPFGPVPVSEFAILGGIVALVVGLLNHGGAAMDVGALLCALGVAEVTAREHFSGFRSHTLLLALMPAIALEAVLALVFGAPSRRVLLLVPVVPVFLGCFWLLRRRFRVARHARIIGHR